MLKICRDSCPATAAGGAHPVSFCSNDPLSKLILRVAWLKNYFLNLTCPYRAIQLGVELVLSSAGSSGVEVVSTWLMHAVEKSLLGDLDVSRYGAGCCWVTPLTMALTSAPLLLARTSTPRCVALTCAHALGFLPATFVLFPFTPRVGFCRSFPGNSFDTFPLIFARVVQKFGVRGLAYVASVLA